MKTRINYLLMVALALFGLAAAAYAQGTAFTYQGRLNDGANPASGNYDLRFAVYDALTAGGQQGVLVTNAAVGVTNGLFTVTLDFGSQFPGAARWLEIAVRTNGAAAFTTLVPRQELTPTPYAITASNLTGALPVAQLSGQVNGSQIANGAVGSAQIDNTTVQARITGTAAAGEFITGINANGTVTTAADTSDWKLGGNNVSPGQFLGSTNNQAVVIKANGVQALRLEPAGSNSVNVVGGGAANGVAPGVVGATIAGGGAGDFNGSAFSNSIASSFGTIGGGVVNEIDASSDYSTIAGGEGHLIASNAQYSTISGGIGNQIQINSQAGVVSGGFGNNIGIYSVGSFIGGGAGNSVGSSNFYAVISGGYNNRIRDNIAGGDDGITIGGGIFNEISTNGYYSTIAGGNSSHIEPNVNSSTIGGGFQSRIQSDANYATVAGGFYNTIQTNANYATIAGGFHNTNLPNAYYATIPGGALNAATNQAFAAGTRAKAIHTGAFVWADAQNVDFISTGTNQFLIRASGGIGINTNNPSGAALNIAGTVMATTFQSPNFSGNGVGLTNVDAPTLGGLASSNYWKLGGNTVGSGQFLGSVNLQPLEFMAGNQRAMRLEYGGTDSPNVVGGSSLNQVSNGVTSATIAGGGRTYTIFSSTFHDPNVIGGSLGTIGGGALNTIGTNSAATISGGYNNSALASDSTLGGGAANRIESAASYSTISGGALNTNTGSYATVPGGDQNSAAANAFAAGHRAKAVNTGAFVWADSQDTNFTSTANNQFLVRAAGGVGINTNNPGATLDVNGSLRVGNGTTIINNLQAGIAQMATGSDTVRTNFTFTFPKAFSSVPNVVISALNGNVSPVDDTFAVSVRDLTATTCTVNIVRVDNPSGWSQHVKINWIAWQ